MILVDTSAWIDFLRGADSPHRHILHQLIEEEADLAITGIVLTEVLQGIQDERDFRRTREYLLAFPVYALSGAGVYVRAAQIYRACRSKGETIRRTVDCLIAALCVENQLVLLHKDRDFDRIAACTGLRCYPVG